MRLERLTRQKQPTQLKRPPPQSRSLRPSPCAWWWTPRCATARWPVADWRQRFPRHALRSTAWTKRVLRDRKSTRLNSSHLVISYAVFCLKKKKKHTPQHHPFHCLVLCCLRNPRVRLCNV